MVVASLFAAWALQIALSVPAGQTSAADPTQADSASAPSGPTRTPVAHPINHPVWESEPDQEDFATAFPERAQTLGVNGRAEIVCIADKDGLLTSCQLRSETPPSWGFGAAALSLSSYWRLKPNDADGLPVVQGIVTLPVTFTPVPQPTPKAPR